MTPFLQAEFLKYRRTFTRRLILLAPLFFVLFALLQRLYMPAGFLPWSFVLALVYNWWPVIFIPLGMALFAALVHSQEMKAGQYRGIRLYPVSPSTVWLAKIVVMACHSLFTTGFLLLSLLLAGLITAGGAVPWDKIFAGGLTLWFVSLPIIPLQLWAATWKGMMGSMTLGVSGLLLGVTAAAKNAWLFVPWSWGIRLMSPIIGVHPNGTMLKAGDPLLDPGVVPVGLMVSCLAFALFTWLTARWFDKREV